MKHKLHIYGCSHSTEHSCDFTEFWGYLLMNKLNLAPGRVTGISGMGYPHIFSLIVDDIFKNNISKNDVVILNTSYENRYTVPFVTIGDTVKRIIKTDWRPKINVESELISSSIRKPTAVNEQPPGDPREYDISLDTPILFDETQIIIDWYNKTRLAYKLLSEVCENVFQWTLSPAGDIDFIYEYLLTNKELRPFETTKYAHLFELLSKIKDEEHAELLPVLKNEWSNLLLPNEKYNCWNDFIIANKISEDDAHMSAVGHNLMYLEFYNNILKSY